METLKQVFAVVGGFVGVISALVTVYAKVLDLKKGAARIEKAEADMAAVLDVQPVVSDKNKASSTVQVPTPAARSEAVAQAAALVKGPALAIIIAGVIGVAFNVLVAGYGYVDEFVTPLSDNHRSMNRASNGAAHANGAENERAGKTPNESSDRASTVLTIVMMIAFSIASCAAIWAGFNMLYLRSYWLSVAGSIAIMPGAAFCCMGGVPVGVWALTVLRKPEVSSVFIN